MNLVCEFCNEEQLSPANLERHTLAVHGRLGTQNPKANQVRGTMLKILYFHYYSSSGNALGVKRSTLYDPLKFTFWVCATVSLPAKIE